jgi:hypothetical protein
VASKYIGIEDLLQESSSGNNVFYAIDILAEHRAMRRQFSPDYTVRLLKGPDFLPRNEDKQLFWYTFVFGGFGSSAEAKAFCAQAFADLSTEARDNHCRSRELPDHR